MAHNTPAVSIRPVTSKARGICKYYTTERGCFSGDRCKFLHSVPKPEGVRENEQPLLTPYDQTKRCKYFDQGFCKRGESCWFLHKPDKNRTVQEEEDDEYCSICFEKAAIYGLLGGCSHIFCLTCIKRWRDPQNKPDGMAESGNTKTCPMCRVSSKFITPSSKFLKNGTEEKQNVTKAYMRSMAKVPCRYFQRSLLKNKTNPICPYGKDCFYGHVKGDGTPYFFKDGVDVCMKRYRKKARRGISLDFMPIEELLQSAFSYTINRINATSDHPTSETQDISASDTPSIHRQHNSGSGDEDGLSPAHRWRIQEAMMRSLNDTNSAGLLAMELLRVGWEITGSGLASSSERDGVEQDSPRSDEQGNDDDDERENEVMERLELMADEMLASVSALREGMPSARSRTHGVPSPSANAPPSRVVQGFSGGMTEQSDDGDMPGLISLSSDSEEDESENDMPGLIALSSDSEEDESESDMPGLSALSSDSEDDESDEGDVDTDESRRDSETATEETDYSGQSEEPTDAAGDSGSSTRTRKIVGVSTSDDEIDEMPELVPIDTSETRSTRQPDTTNVIPPVTSTSGQASGSSRPSDAFTTDGRGRVINVGDSTSDFPEQPESPAGGPSETHEAERRGGFFGWIGSLI